MDVVSSPEKIDTKISKKKIFRLAISVSDNPINSLSMRIFYTSGLFTVKRAKEGVMGRPFYKICGGRGPPE